MDGLSESFWFKLKSDYDAQGFCGPIQVFDDEKVVETKLGYANYVKTLETEYGLSTPSGDWRFRVHLLQDWALAVATSEVLVKAVKKVLATENVLVWSTDLNIKDPNTEKFYSWHQDSTYAGLHPAGNCVTAWYALTDATELNGCLRFSPGSHVFGQVEHVEGFREKENALSLSQRVSDSQTIDAATSNQVLLELNAGEASLHSFFTIHCSGPNSSQNSRVGLAIRYVDASKVQPREGKREYATLVAGNIPSNSRFIKERVSQASSFQASKKFDESRLETWRMSMENEKQNYFDATHIKAFK